MASNLIAIVGPTASGKSDFAVRYAIYLKNNFGVEAEIVNADSIQMYNALKIITSYPSYDSLKLVRHCLYGVLSPQEVISVAIWLDLVKKEIHRIHSENKVAIICGGTGFYINALINGISDIPVIPKYFRNEVLRKFQQLGREEFFNQLVFLDPELCKILHKNNTQRILRAYEVVTYTGKPLSSWWKSKSECNYQISPIVLLPPRDRLNERCLIRINKMIAVGAIDEIRRFVEEYPNYTGILCSVIGYHEIISFLNKAISFDECVERMYVRTKQYAKRQSTWFRNQLKSSQIIYEFGDETEVASLKILINLK
ncbi:MAG: tRNA (adenosine(37)-N6)-dimethylallyltransferase MiaA [Holosporaceae bacterium]|nr:tRNA (adenosine(37)-N6)-dimethylallyltransferase MiaA [Holosporaceae bacterium]